MSVDIYVILAIIAAAIIVLAARPRTRSEMRDYLLGSTLMPDESIDAPAGAAVEFRCLDSGLVIMERYGLSDVTMSGAVSMAAHFDGVNLQIEERLVPGRPEDPLAWRAVFEIDFLPPGRYHVTYNSDRSGLFAAFSLHVRPGIVATRILSR